MSYPFIKVNDAVEFSWNWGVQIDECAVDMDPVELHESLKLAFQHAKNPQLQSISWERRDLPWLNEPGRLPRLSFETYLAHCKEMEIEGATHEAKRRHVKRRRSEYSASRSQLVLAMIDAGVQHVCCVEGCHLTKDLTIDHIIPLSRGGSDDIANLRFMCRSHNSQKRDRLE